MAESGLFLFSFLDWVVMAAHIPLANEQVYEYLIIPLTFDPLTALLKRIGEANAAAPCVQRKYISVHYFLEISLLGSI